MHLSRMVPLPRARRWETEWNGRRIAVKNGLRERLLVDGQVVAENPPRVAVDARFCAQVLHGDRAHEISARVAAIAGGPRMGCHIFVDGVLVGGDVSEKLGAPGHKAEAKMSKSVEEQKREARDELRTSLLLAPVFTSVFAWWAHPLWARDPVGVAFLLALIASTYIVKPACKLWRLSRDANKVR